MNTIQSNPYFNTAQKAFVELSRHILVVLSVALITLAVTGCAKHEKVIEVDAPGTSIDVERVTQPDGDVDLKVETVTP
jgi:hypothetical protein